MVLGAISASLECAAQALYIWKEGYLVGVGKPRARQLMKKNLRIEGNVVRCVSSDMEFDVEFGGWVCRERRSERKSKVNLENGCGREVPVHLPHNSKQRSQTSRERDTAQCLEGAVARLGRNYSSVRPCAKRCHTSLKRER